MGWAPDVIERQLAHAERNKVRAAYNRAQYMAERKKMMQAWADYLDALRTSANVVPLRPDGAACGGRNPCDGFPQNSAKPGKAAEPGVSGDRKSTRLNYSH